MDTELGAVYISVLFRILCPVFVAILTAAGETLAADTCSFQQGSTTVVAYCEDGCCDNDCCGSSSSNSADPELVLIIVAVCAGVVLIVLLIIAIACWCKHRRKGKSNEQDCIELTETPTVSATLDQAAAKSGKKKTVGSSGKECDPKSSRQFPTKETTFTNVRGTTAAHRSKAKKHLSRRRNSRDKYTGGPLPQVEEIEEL